MVMLSRWDILRYIWIFLARSLIPSVYYNVCAGCTYKQFLDCKLVNFDGTGGAVAFVRWAEKTESVLRMSKCAPEQQVTYISGLFLDGACDTWVTATFKQIPSQ